MAFDLLMRDGILVHGTGAPLAVHLAGTEAVIVNGAETVRVGVETGARPGRLPRRP